MRQRRFRLRQVADEDAARAFDDQFPLHPRDVFETAAISLLDGAIRHFAIRTKVMLQRLVAGGAQVLTAVNAERLVSALQGLGITFLDADASGPGIRIRASID